MRKSFRLKPGTRHVAVVRVRQDRLQAYMNGRLLIDAETDYRNLSKKPEFSQPDDSSLGLGTSAPARFHQVEVFEVTYGAGATN